MPSPTSWGSRGRGFKSRRPDWFFERLWPLLGTKWERSRLAVPDGASRAPRICSTSHGGERRSPARCSCWSPLRPVRLARQRAELVLDPVATHLLLIASSARQRRASHGGDTSAGIGAH